MDVRSWHYIITCFIKAWTLSCIVLHDSILRNVYNVINMKLLVSFLHISVMRWDWGHGKAIVASGHSLDTALYWRFYVTTYYLQQTVTSIWLPEEIWREQQGTTGHIRGWLKYMNHSVQSPGLKVLIMTTDTSMHSVSWFWQEAAQRVGPADRNHLNISNL